MVSMLFPWHFSGILWHPGGMPWTLCYFHGISVELYAIQVECHGIPWNSMECHGRYIISMAFQWNSMAFLQWNAMDTEDWYS